MRGWPWSSAQEPPERPHNGFDSELENDSRTRQASAASTAPAAPLTYATGPAMALGPPTANLAQSTRFEQALSERLGRGEPPSDQPPMYQPRGGPRFTGSLMYQPPSDHGLAGSPGLGSMASSLENTSASLDLSSRSLDLGSRTGFLAGRGLGTGPRAPSSERGVVGGGWAGMEPGPLGPLGLPSLASRLDQGRSGTNTPRSEASGFVGLGRFEAATPPPLTHSNLAGHNVDLGEHQPDPSRFLRHNLGPQGGLTSGALTPRSEMGSEVCALLGAAVGDNLVSAQLARFQRELTQLKTDVNTKLTAIQLTGLKAEATYAESEQHVREMRLAVERERLERQRVDEELRTQFESLNLTADAGQRINALLTATKQLEELTAGQASEQQERRQLQEACQQELAQMRAELALQAQIVSQWSALPDAFQQERQEREAQQRIFKQQLVDHESAAESLEQELRAKSDALQEQLDLSCAQLQEQLTLSSEQLLEQLALGSEQHAASAGREVSELRAAHSEAAELGRAAHADVGRETAELGERAAAMHLRLSQVAKQLEAQGQGLQASQQQAQSLEQQLQASAGREAQLAQLQEDLRLELRQRGEASENFQRDLEERCRRLEAGLAAPDAALRQLRQDLRQLAEDQATRHDAIAGIVAEQHGELESRFASDLAALQEEGKSNVESFQVALTGLADQIRQELDAVQQQSQSVPEASIDEHEEAVRQELEKAAASTASALQSIEARAAEHTERIHVLELSAAESMQALRLELRTLVAEGTTQQGSALQTAVASLREEVETAAEDSRKLANGFGVGVSSTPTLSEEPSVAALRERVEKLESRLPEVVRSTSTALSGSRPGSVRSGATAVLWHGAQEEASLRPPQGNSVPAPPGAGANASALRVASPDVRRTSFSVQAPSATAPAPHSVLRGCMPELPGGGSFGIPAVPGSPVPAMKPTPIGPVTPISVRSRGLGQHYQPSPVPSASVTPSASLRSPALTSAGLGMAPRRW